MDNNLIAKQNEKLDQDLVFLKGQYRKLNVKSLVYSRKLERTQIKTLKSGSNLEIYLDNRELWSKKFFHLYSKALTDLHSQTPEYPIPPSPDSEVENQKFQVIATDNSQTLKICDLVICLFSDADISEGFIGDLREHFSSRIVLKHGPFWGKIWYAIQTIRFFGAGISKVLKLLIGIELFQTVIKRFTP